MAKVEIYTTQICPFCVRAKQLLTKKGVEFVEYDVMRDREKRAEMEQRTQGHTVPQILIDDKVIGGCDDLFELDFDDELDPMLGL